MSLTYKNLCKNVILDTYKNLRYVTSSPLFGSDNTLEISIALAPEVQQICLQGDVFARALLAKQSDFDFKRFLGIKQENWQTLLIETYVYSYIKCIYFGMSYNSISEYPANSYAFPGHILLCHFLSDRNYNLRSDEGECSVSLFITIDGASTLKDFVKQFSEVIPDLEDGMSRNENVISYVNVKYENILYGLNNALTFMKGKKNNAGKEPLYQINLINDETLGCFSTEDSLPLINSFLSKDGKIFSFINKSNDGASATSLKYNESLYISRALGFTSSGLKSFGNDYYLHVPRNPITDLLTREEVYSVTALKTDIVPYSYSEIVKLLGIGLEDLTSNDSNFTNSSRTE